MTYSYECDGEICHAVPEGEEDHLWWFGFDCAHAYDYIPAVGGFYSQMAEYRDINYAKKETERLAEQLANLEGKE